MGDGIMVYSYITYLSGPMFGEKPIEACNYSDSESDIKAQWKFDASVMKVSDVQSPGCHVGMGYTSKLTMEPGDSGNVYTKFLPSKAQAAIDGIETILGTVKTTENAPY